MLEEFVSNLHPSATLVSRGTAEVLGHTVDAVKVRNLYGQEVVWGMFNVDKGKFRGKRLANDCATEEVHYHENQ